MFCPAACRDVWKVLNLPQESILANTSEMHNREGEVGYSTNGYKVIDYLISGWSEKVFDVLKAIDEGADALDQIKNIEI